MRGKDSRCLEVILFLLILIHAPQVLHAGDFYTVNVFYDFDKPTNITYYEYVFNGTNCISSGWTANKESKVIKSENVTIYDRINPNAPSGIYKLRVRTIINGTKYDRTVKVAIIGKETNYYYIISSVFSAGVLFYIFKRFR